MHELRTNALKVYVSRINAELVAQSSQEAV